jgi:hypothetical protein
MGCGHTTSLPELDRRGTKHPERVLRHPPTGFATAFRTFAGESLTGQRQCQGRSRAKHDCRAPASGPVKGSLASTNAGGPGRRTGRATRDPLQRPRQAQEQRSLAHRPSRHRPGSCPAQPCDSTSRRRCGVPAGGRCSFRLLGALWAPAAGLLCLPRSSSAALLVSGRFRSHGRLVEQPITHRDSRPARGSEAA